MYNPILSICIPTYNREFFLKELLESIFDQIPSNGSVEICISDNASTDNTMEVITNFSKTFKYITYYRNKKNLGADKNYLKVVAIAKGKYCWFIGSDDKLIEHSLAEIITSITKTYLNLDILVFNRKLWYFGKKVEDEQKWLRKEQDTHIFNLSNKNEFIDYCTKSKLIGSLFSYLSSIVFLKSKWDLALPGNESFIGSAYVHVYVLLNMIKMNSSCRLLYLNKALVLSRTGNDSFIKHTDILKRSLLDLNGYNKLSKIFIDKEIQQSILSVLFKTIKQDMSFIKTIYSSANSPKISINNSINCVKEHVELSSIYKSLLFISYIYYIPGIKKIIQTCFRLAVGFRHFLRIRRK